ncbi:MAG: decaprenyl-phosphate phosphoribosyltransferase [Terriglobia bacterium]
METLTGPEILEAAVKPQSLGLPAVFEALRPHQWIKNAFVFAALLFAERLTDRDSVTTACLAALVFCGMSSAVYLLNDVMDRAEDRLHPTKCLRPVAAGRVSVPVALALAAALATAALAGSWKVDRGLFEVLAVYAVMNLAYSTWLKHVLLLDVFIIAAGFVLRVLGGGIAIHVRISSWLIVCTTLLALFMALSKRRHELVLLGENGARHRANLEHYSPYFLDQLITIVTASAVMSYALYTLSAAARAQFPGKHLALTIPFVVFGIFRYLFLVHQREEGGNPARTLLADTVLLSTVLLWAGSVVLIIYF